MSDKEIDDVLNSESNDDSDGSILDMDADTDTMNNQLSNRMKKQKKKNSNSNSIDEVDDEPKIICQIDKNTLKTLIIEWLSLDDQIKSYNDIIKDLKEEKKQFESQILDVMGALNQEIILTDKGNLTKTIKESKEALTPDLIKSTLTEILKCTETADTYTNQIMEKRKVKETINLKRKDVNAKQSKPKQPKQPKQFNRGKKNNNNDNNDNDNRALDV
jgi:hypothetical protein